MTIDIQEDFTGYFQDALPEAHIERVTLSEGGKPSVEQLKMIWSEDPHVKSQRWSFIAKNLYKGQDLWEGVPGDKRVVAELQVVMNALIPRAKDIFSSFIYNEEFFKYFKVFVISNNDAETYEKVLAASALEPIEQLKQLKSSGTFKSVFQYSDDVNSKVTLKSDESILANSNVQTYSPSHAVIASVEETASGTKVFGFDRKIDNNGNTIISIPLEFEFSYISDPYHLSFFVITMLDTNKIKEDYPDIETMELEFVSRILPMLVVHQGRVATKKSIYKTVPSGKRGWYGDAKSKIWTGPVHQMPDGSWMTGRTHEPFRLIHGEKRTADMFKHLTPEAYAKLAANGLGIGSTIGGDQYKGSRRLERLEVDNSHIQDFRNIEEGSGPATKKRWIQSEIAGGEAREAEQNYLQKGNIKYLTNDRSDVEINAPYFSDLLITKDIQFGSNVRFFFSMDYMSLIEDLGIFSNLIYPTWLGGSLKRDFYRDILQKSQILSFKIVRKRTKLSHSGIDKLGYPALEDFDEEEIPTLIATYSPTAITETPKIRRVTLGQNGAMNDPYMKHFSVIDTEIAGASYGNYIYGLELEVLDGTVKYISEALKFVSDRYTSLKKYYDIASTGDERGPYYNKTSKKFNSRLRDKLFAAALAQDPTGGSVSIFSHTNLLKEFYKEYLDKWIVLSRQVDVGKMPHPEKLENTLQNMVKTTIAAPAATGGPTGTLKGIESVLKHMEKFYKSLEKLLDGAVSGPVTKTPVAKGTGQGASHFKSDATRTIKIKKWFADLDEVVDVENPINTGYEFLTGHGPMASLISRNFFPGLVSMSPNSYENRCLVETKKHFKDPNLTTATAWRIVTEGPATIAQPSDFDTSDTQYSYLTPGVVHFRNKTIPLIGSDLNFLNTKFYDNDVYYDILLKSIRHNKSLDTSKEPHALNNNDEFQSNFPVGEQKIRNGLLDLFAAHNCTISSMKEFRNNKEVNVDLHTARKQNAGSISKEDAFAQMFANIGAQPMLRLLPSISWNDSNPSSELSALLSFYMHIGGSSVAKSGIFNLNNKDDTIINLTQKKKNQLPNQIKALILLMTNSITYMHPGLDSSDYVNHLRLDINKIMGETFSQTAFPFFYYNFYNINEIQILAGYQMYKKPNEFGYPSIRTRPNMKAPRWYTMNKTRLNNARGYLQNIGHVEVCRQIPYTNSSINLPDFPNIDIQTYNEYFFLEGRPTLDKDAMEASTAIKQGINEIKADSATNSLAISLEVQQILQIAVEQALGTQLSAKFINAIEENVKILGGDVFRAFEFKPGLDMSITQEQARQLIDPNMKIDFEPFPIADLSIQDIIDKVDLTKATRDFLRMKSIEAAPAGGPFKGLVHLFIQFEIVAKPTGAAPPKVGDGIAMLRDGIAARFSAAAAAATSEGERAAMKRLAVSFPQAWVFNGEILARFIEKAIADNGSYNSQAKKQVEDAIAAEEAWWQASPF